MAAKPLVIVESPAKAKTLGRFLGEQIPGRGELRSYSRPSRVGCGRAEGDQGKGLGATRCWRSSSDFTPYYVVPSDKRKQVAHLKTAVKEASELLLATNPRSRRRVNQLAPGAGPEAQSSRPTHRLPRDHRRRGQGSARESRRGQREPGSRAGEPPHPQGIGSTATRSLLSSGRRSRQG